MEHAVVLAGVCKSYGSFTLGPVSFAVPAGQVIGLVGPNGAGKSTTIRVLMGAVARDSGDVEVLGVSVGGPAWIPAKQDIAVVMDDLCLPSVLTADDAGRLYAGLYPRWDAKRFALLCERFALDRRKRIKEYSRGMRIRLSVMLAVASCPRLLVMDEPTSGLDPVAREEMLDLFQSFMEDEQHSILISSHITSDLQRIADRIVCLANGRVLLDESKDDLLYRYGIFKGTHSQFEQVDSAKFVSMRVGRFGMEALASDRVVVQQLYPDLMCDQSDLETVVMHVLRPNTGPGMQEVS